MAFVSLAIYGKAIQFALKDAISEKVLSNYLTGQFEGLQGTSEWRSQIGMDLVGGMRHKLFLAYCDIADRQFGRIIP